jgi:hypothetical protein
MAPHATHRGGARLAHAGTNRAPGHDARHTPSRQARRPARPFPAAIPLRSAAPVFALSAGAATGDGRSAGRPAPHVVSAAGGGVSWHRLQVRLDSATPRSSPRRRCRAASGGFLGFGLALPHTPISYRGWRFEAQPQTWVHSLHKPLPCLHRERWGTLAQLRETCFRLSVCSALYHYAPQAHIGLLR